MNPADYDCGYCYYHIALRDKEKRKEFKKAVNNWYEQNKDNLIWVKNNSFSTYECSGKHPAGGHYEIKK